MDYFILAKTFEINNILVAVNFMDKVNFEEEKFKKIKQVMEKCATKCSLKNISFIPISSLKDINLQSRNLKFWNNETFIEMLMNIYAKLRFSNWKICSESIFSKKIEKDEKELKPLRITVNNVKKIPHVGTVISGKVIYGTLQNNENIIIEPSGIETSVKNIQMNKINIEKAYPGDFVSILVYSGKLKIDPKKKKNMYRGCIIGGKKQQPPLEATTIIAQIVIISKTGNDIKKNFQPLLFIHNEFIPVQLDEIQYKLDKISKKKIENATSLKNGDTAIVKLILQKPLCCETFDQFESLARFILRDGGKKICAVGKIIGFETKNKKRIVISKTINSKDLIEQNIKKEISKKVTPKIEYTHLFNNVWEKAIFMQREWENLIYQ